MFLLSLLPMMLAGAVLVLILSVLRGPRQKGQHLSEAQATLASHRSSVAEGIEEKN